MIGIPLTKRVALDGRTFVVSYDDEGQPRSIKERRLKDGRIVLGTYWHRSNGRRTPQSIAGRIILAAGSPQHVRNDDAR